MSDSRGYHSSSWYEPEDDHRCKSCWVFKGTDFPCDLEEDHPGPHINYPTKKGHDAAVIWTCSGGEDQ